MGPKLEGEGVNLSSQAMLKNSNDSYNAETGSGHMASRERVWKRVESELHAGNDVQSTYNCTYCNVEPVVHILGAA